MSRKKASRPSPNTSGGEKWKKHFNLIWVGALLLVTIIGIIVSRYVSWILALSILLIGFAGIFYIDHFYVEKETLKRVTTGLSCLVSILLAILFKDPRRQEPSIPYPVSDQSEVPSFPSTSFHDEGFDKSLALKSARDEMDSGAPSDTVGLDSETKLLKTLIWGYKRAETERTKRYILDEVESIEPSSARSASMISYFYYETDQFDKAIDYLLHAFDFLDSEDRLFDLNYRLCLSYLGEDDYEKAAYYCDRAIDSKGAENHLISLYSLRADCINDYFRKYDYISKGLALKPSTAEDFFYRGVMFDEIHESDSSVANYTKAIDLSPKKGKYYFNRGLEQYYSCKPHQAYEDFMHAYSLGYSENNVCFWIGMSLMAQSNAEEASSYFTRNIQNNNKHWISYLWRGIANLICHNQSSFEIALRDFCKLAENGVYYSDLLLFKSFAELRCKVEEWSENRDEWQSSFLSNMSLSQDNIPSWWDYCSYDVINELIKLYSQFNYNIIGRDSSTLYCRIGIAYYYMHQYRKAKRAFSRAIKYSDYNDGLKFSELFPEECREAADLYNNKSVAERRLWLFRRRAIRDVTKAISIEPNLDYLYVSRAKLYWRKGNYKKVAADYCKAIQIDSSRNDYYYELGDIYSRLKEYEKAISCFEKAIQLDSTDKRSREELMLAKTFKAIEDSEEIMERNERILSGKDKNGELELLPIPE